MLLEKFTASLISSILFKTTIMNDTLGASQADYAIWFPVRESQESPIFCKDVTPAFLHCYIAFLEEVD